MTDDTQRQTAGSPACPDDPGKIVAIHLSYASRADQRGRRPAHPSYFLKPSSSVAPSGGTVERPARHRAARLRGRDRARHRHRRPARAPGPRPGTTSRGSRRRTTSGCTTCARTTRARTSGPRAGTGSPRSDPASSTPAPSTRPRCGCATWVNGELRQDDTTAGLLFTLPQLVADLSQHLTLEPGDVILTGTPAGSSVVVPGDVVEVEVDAPDAPGRADLGPARHDRHPGRARVRRRARVAARRRRRPARRGVGRANRHPRGSASPRSCARSSCGPRSPGSARSCASAASTP